MQNKNYRSKAMFPNYCFTRSAKEPGYDVVKRCYMPKDSHHYPNRRVGRHLSRSEALASSQYRIGPRNADSAASSALRDLNSKRVKRLRKPKKSNSIRRMGSDESPSCKVPPPSRSVEFRLPPVVCEMSDKGQAGDASDGPRENGGHEPGDRNQERDSRGESSQHHENITEVPLPHDPNRDLQESCADFFSIIHDNVLEAVQGAVHRMIAKCFEGTVAQIAHLSAELSHQKSLLNKLYREVTDQLAEQSETNMNQFKFLTQMLIDNQTIHYRALNSAQQNQQRRNEEREREHEKERARDRRRRSTSSSIESQSRSTGGESFKSRVQQQHKLCQQQQPNIYYSQLCRQCTEQDANGKSQTRRQCSKSATVKRLAKGIGTVSMPDLGRTQSTWSRSKIKRIPTPNDAGGGPTRQPSRHRFFTSSRSSSVRRQPSAVKTDPYQSPPHRPQRSSSKARRKLSHQSKAEPSLEDVRSRR